MDQKFIDLHDEYTHAPLPRRVFLKRLAMLAGGVAAAEALLPLLEVDYAAAQMVSPRDGRLTTGTVSYRGANGNIRAYQARPRGGGKMPAVVVIHENRGLNPHIEDVARRLALAGFLAIAPDALSPIGGTPADRDEARSMIYSLDREETLNNYLAAVRFAKSHRFSTGKVGCVGFCWGGGMSNQLAVHSRELDAAVAFYGRTPRATQVAKIKAPLLLHYAGLDRRINAGVPAYEAALKTAGVRYRMHVYAGVNHAFHNDTAASRYDKKAARLAWQRTLAFFSETLAK
ncbi:MAG: dienelactone hydrolase family protein [bacterium]